MTRTMWLCATAAMIGCGLTGCADVEMNNGQTGQQGNQAQSRRLMAKVNPPVLDIPVPIGFDLDEARSRNRSGAGTRFVDHVYTGRAEKFDVVRFYRRHMPEHGWKEMSYQFAQGSGVFSFEKSVAGYKEESTVIVRDGGLWDRIEIIVAVGPRGPASVPANPN
ncbi:MAG: hypothetical protein ACLFUJ_11035 [Phycisphaerae bacterium]